MKRWLIRIGVALLILLVLAVATVYWLIGSETGARVLSSLAEDNLPGLTLAYESGTALKGLRFKHIGYQADGTEAHIADLFVQAKPTALTPRTSLQVVALRAASVEVTTAQTDESTPPPELAVPELPIDIEWLQVNIGRITINGTQIDQLSTAGSWTPARIRVEPLRLIFSDVALHIEAQVDPDPIHMDSTIGWETAGAHGAATLAGTPQALKVAHQLTLEDGRSLSSRGNVQIDDLEDVQADLTHAAADPAVQLRTVVRYSPTAAELQIAGNALGIALDSVIAAHLAEPEPRIEIRSAEVDGGLSLTGEVVLAAEPFGSLSVQIEPGKLSNPEAAAVSGKLAAQIEFEGQTNIQATLGADALSFGTYEIKALSASLTGSMSDLALRATWDSGAINATVQQHDGALAVGIAPESHLTLAGARWQPSQNASVSVEEDRLTISPHCWAGVGSVCLDRTEVHGSSINLSGTISELRLSQFNETLPYPISDGGQIDGRWNITTSDADPPVGDAIVTISPITLVTNGQTLVLPSLEADLAMRNGWLATARGSSDNLQLDASFSGDALDPGTALRGSGSITIQQLQAYQPLVPQLAALGGQISAELAISGTLGAPDLMVTGDWQHGRLHLAEPDFDLRDVRGTVSVAGQDWTVALQGTPPGGGALDITGAGRGYDATATADLKVTGSGLQAASRDWRVQLAPDLSLTADGGQLRVSGAVNVPTARVEITTLPESLPRPSKDVRVVGREEAEPESAATLNGDVNLVLGDDVQLHILGLKIGLAGQLTATLADDELTRLTGELRVTDGSLKSGGQDLAIESGRIRFTGDPENPYIDLVATRSIEDQSPALKVGVRVRGPSDDLQTQLYSEPPIEEARILSFLAFGRDLGSGDGEVSDEQLLAAALSYGLGQSEGIVAQLRGSLGLDELSAMSAAHNDVAIVAGKRISDDLYVRYRYNALSAVGALIIRYHLSERLRLETSTEAGSSMDLLYEFSR